ncbi:MAG: hypothetical protein OEO19_16960 [Gammaproteobacteria bacterium]|nr:hypothetical protein [Gammaproteobacteria bacterium]
MKTTSRHYYLALLVMLVGPVVSIPGFAQATGDQASVEQIQQETRELLQALQNYTAAQRDEALRKIKTAQDNLDRRIEVLEREIAKNWDEMDEAAREKSLATLQALRQQRTAVAEYYGSLKTSSAAAWGHIKEGFSSAYGALHEAWEKAEKEFAKEE